VQLATTVLEGFPVESGKDSANILSRGSVYMKLNPHGLFIMQCRGGLDVGGAKCRKYDRSQRRREQHSRYREERQEIRAADAIQEAGGEPSQGQGDSQPDGESHSS